MAAGGEERVVINITIPIVFWRTVPVIAEVLCIHERTVRKMIAAGDLPVKKDGAGVWVLTNIDYYRSLVG